MAKGGQRTVEIQSGKLREALKKRGVEPREASYAMGYQPNYLSVAFARGVLSKTAAVALKTLYNIAQEEYEAVDEVQAVEPTDEERIAEIVEKVLVDKSGMIKGMLRAVIREVLAE